MFPQNRLKICILMFLLLVYIVYTDDPDPIPLQNRLRNIFHYNIWEHHEPGHVVVWKVTSDPETLSLQDYREGFRTFATDETYLLLAKKSRDKLMVHYWMGNRAPLENKITVAKYAMTLFTLIHELYLIQYYNIIPVASTGINLVFISREQESLVSEAFQHTINLIKGTIKLIGRYGQHPRYVDTQFLSALPSLYVLTGNDYLISIKKVPILIGLKWLPRNDICLILETGYDIVELSSINIFCGSETSHWVQEVATDFAVKFQVVHFAHNWISDRLNIAYRDARWKQILEVLEDHLLYKFYEMDNSNDNLKDKNEFIGYRSNVISIFRISNHGILEPVERTNIISCLFHNNACYILNSASAAGLFLIFGKRTGIEEKVAAIQIMEDYIHRTLQSLPIPTPIRIANGLSIPFADGEIPIDNIIMIDLLLNLDDWPLERIQHNQ